MAFSKKLWTALILGIVGFCALAEGGLAEEQAAPGAKKPVLTADDLPRHTYAVSMAPSKILLDPAAFAALATSVKADLESDLASYDIKDRTALQRYKSSSFRWPCSTATIPPPGN